MDFFVAELLNAVKLGSIYALVAIGYSVVYSIMGLINFAHGELLMIATYSLWGLMVLSVPFPLAVVLAVAITAAFGILIERIAYRPLRNHGEETLIITSLAVSVFLQSICQTIFGVNNQALQLPAVFSKRFALGGTSISVMNIVIFVVTAALILGVSLLIKKTKLGMAMRACADNSQAADLMGIDRTKVIVFSFGVGSVLAALAGMMYSGEYISFSPTMGFMLGIKAFIAAVIGGLGSFGGAAAGGFIMGFLEIFLAGYLPDGVSTYQTAFVFLILILVLLIRPNGLFGSNGGKRS